ncbi:hypothetical protein LY474_33700 [Myxococcus stipitatus]|uniref:hypothetical protein n=1 Tax=Myxococcus stipitatus TaxID=83455 RepID=UPI001F2EA3DA|nr:hypothetical protein [Myxococcus stipitatus]MCE9672772.1 hypothetical protein [Myxococcus stipitatus]
MPGTSDLRCLASLFVLTFSCLSAQAAEVSAAERVETTPGVSPEVVRRVFDGQRQALSRCMRLVSEVQREGAPMRFVPWKEPVDADDRVLFRFKIGANGKVARPNSYQSTMEVRGVFLLSHCAERVAEQWTFPALTGVEVVEVSVWARYRSTEAERKAALASIHEGFTALCKAVSSATPDGAEPSREVWTATLARLVSERGTSLHWSVNNSIDAVRGVNVSDASTILVSAMEELVANVDCPKLRAWARH